MDRYIPTRLLHLTIFCRSCSGPNVWKGSWLATVPFFFFLSYSAAAAKYKKKNLIPSPPQPNTFLGKFFQFFFEKFLYIYAFVLTHAESLDNLPRPFNFFFF